MKEIINSTSILIIILITALCGIIIWLLPSSERTLSNYISIISCGLTILGFIVAILQIVKVGNIAINTEKEVSKKIKSFNQTLFYSDIAKIEPLINEIKKYLRTRNYEISISKLDSIKSLLIIIGHNHLDHNVEINEKELRKHLRNLSIDTNSLEKKINNPNNELDIPLLLENIEQIKSFLLRIKSQIQII